MLLGLLPFFSYAQDFSNKGKDFWIGYGNHIRMFNSGAAEKMQIYVTSDVSTLGKVEIASIGFSQTFTVVANQITTIDIPRTAALLDHGFYDHGIHVTADKPIVVYSFIYVNAISGATVCLPTATLGREYFSVNYTQTSNEQNSHSYFFVVATDTGTTTVEITPSQDTKGNQPAGVPFTINLKQGQIYQVLGKVSNLAGVDLTGSKIRSVSSAAGGCKKIAVFSGSGKIKIGTNCAGNSASSDNLYQQMYPTATWGKKYITAPGLVNSNNYYRIVLSDPSAIVKLNGTVIPAASFTNNFYYDFLSNAANVIESDKPVLVAQYFTTQSCNGNPVPSDPDMIYLNPVEQTIDKVTLNSMQPTTGTAVTQHYLNVILKNDAAAINSFTIDGVAYNNFIPVPADPGYVYARITTTAGTHNITCDTGFNIIAYGFGNAESYGYSGGTNLKDLYQFVSIKNKYATVDFPAACKNSPFYFSMTFPYMPTKIKWQFNGLFTDFTIDSPVPDSTWEVNGKQLYLYRIPTPYTITATGTYPIKVIANNPTFDGCSGEQEINYDLQVYERPTGAFNFSTTDCITDSVYFTDASNSNGRPIIKWDWNFGDNNSSLQKNPVHKYVVADEYKINFSVITDIGCLSDTVTKTIKLYEPPVAKFGVSYPFCVGEPITFSDSSLSPKASILKWIWNFGDGTPDVVAGNGSDQTHTYTKTGKYIITLKVENAGCESLVYSKEISINPFPVPYFPLPENCLSDPFTQFNDSSLIADGTETGFVYLWNFDDVNATPSNQNTSVLKDPQHKYTAVGNYNVKLTVTSSNGCVADTIRTITINGIVPQSSFTVQGGTEHCSGNNISIINNSDVDFGNVVKVEVYWDYANDPTNKIVDDQPKPGEIYTYHYPLFYNPETKNAIITLVAYSGENCLSSVSQTIILKARPEIKLTSTTPICADVLPFMLPKPKVVNGLTGSEAYTGKGISFAGLFSPAIAGVGTHNITYTFTAENGCTTSVDQLITVLPVPTANAGPDKFLLEGGVINLSGSGTGNNISYLWSPSTGLSSTIIPDPSVSISNDNNYKLTVTNEEGCVATDEVTVKVLKAISIPNAFSPNGDGVHDKWEIKYLDSYPGASIEVFNRYGQLIFKSTGYSKAWDGTNGGKQLPIGTYYYIINPKNGRKQQAGFVDIIR